MVRSRMRKSGPRRTSTGCALKARLHMQRYGRAFGGPLVGNVSLLLLYEASRGTLAGFPAFVNLYSPQALLPQLAREFHVSAGEISALMTAGTAAIALSAPFTGAVADVVGRKRLITAALFAVVVPMLIMTFAGSVPQLIFWRFVQGLLLPPIFAVTVAYIGDEWPPAEVTRVAGLYISGSAIGGFSGRFVPGLLTDVIGWRAAFQVVAVLTLAAAIIVATSLPRERNFTRS